MKKNILLVDDEKSIREVVKDILEYEGYNVILGENCEEAIRKAASLSPDLMVLDLGIPTIGGLEVCRILKKDKKTMSACKELKGSRTSSSMSTSSTS